MTYRSMAKTAPDKIKDIDEKNPENKDVQSVQEAKMKADDNAYMYVNKKNV